MKNRRNSDNSIVDINTIFENGQNTEKSPVDLSRHVVTRIPVKELQPMKGVK